MNERVLIFANPVAGRGRAVKLAQAVASEVQRISAEKGRAVAGVLVTDQPKLADLSAGDFGHLPILSVACVGGDGTLREVVGRLLTWNKQTGQPLPPVLPLAGGTANLMSLHLGLRQAGLDMNRPDVATIAAGMLLQPKVREIDLTRVTLESDSGEENDGGGGGVDGGVMLVTAGVGFDATVVHEVHRRRTGPIGHQDYLLPILQTLGSNDAFPRVALQADGKDIFGFRGENGLAGERAIVFIGNVREYGTGFSMTPLAQSDDRLLDVCCLPCSNAVQVTDLAIQAASGNLLDCEGAVYVRARQVRIVSFGDAPAKVQVDGDSAGHTPVRFDVMKRRMGMIIGRTP